MTTITTDVDTTTTTPCGAAAEGIDPSCPALGGDGTSSNAASYLGDGYCDTIFNTDRCGWDGGDCCAETCACEGPCCADANKVCSSFSCKGIYPLASVC